MHDDLGNLLLLGNYQIYSNSSFFKFEYLFTDLPTLIRDIRSYVDFNTVQVFYHHYSNVKIIFVVPRYTYWNKNNNNIT